MNILSHSLKWTWSAKFALYNLYRILWILTNHLITILTWGKINKWRELKKSSQFFSSSKSWSYLHCVDFKSKCFKNWSTGPVSNRLQGIPHHCCSSKQKCVFGEGRGCVHLSVCVSWFSKRQRLNNRLMRLSQQSPVEISELGRRLI